MLYSRTWDAHQPRFRKSQRNFIKNLKFISGQGGGAKAQAKLAAQVFEEALRDFVDVLHEAGMEVVRRRRRLMSEMRVKPYLFHARL